MLNVSVNEYSSVMTYIIILLV